MKFFNNNLGIHAVIIYFYFVLVDLINDYKNVYSHNVCMMVFLCGGFLYKLLVCTDFYENYYFKFFF